MTESKDNWRETLYIWDGIVTARMPSLAAEDSAKNSESAPIPLHWEGSWLPITGAPDAATVEAPKRNAFKRDMDAECKFAVGGNATPLTRKGDEKDDNDNDDKEHFFLAKLVDGTGWEMRDGDGEAKATHKDSVHDVLLKTIRWSGNQKDETESLVVAKGENAFGPFCSVGWMRPGCRWTVARRYLPEEDPRAKWSLEEFYDVVVKEAIGDVEVAGTSKGGEEKAIKRLNLPPWQAAVMHVDHTGGEKQEQEDGGGKRQKVDKD